MGITFTTDQLNMARAADLCDIASNLGFTVKEIGRYHTVKEMDSLRIYDRRTWFRFSERQGGNQIDFVMKFGLMGFKDAVSFILNNGFRTVSGPGITGEDMKVFRLPFKALSDTNARNYLINQRAISPAIVDELISRGLIYESKEHQNVVFVGYDMLGEARYAFMRGTKDKFKCDAFGSDKTYGFHIEASGSDTVRVFEGAIDAISFYDATKLSSDHLLALGMLDDKALERYLLDRPQIRKIYLCLDNDNPGIKAAERIQEKYEKEGYDVTDLGSPVGYKDYNEWHVASKERMIFTLVSEPKRTSR